MKKTASALEKLRDNKVSFKDCIDDLILFGGIDCDLIKELSSTEFFNIALEKKMLTKENLQYFIDHMKESLLPVFHANSNFLIYGLSNSLFDFKTIVDMYHRLEDFYVSRIRKSKTSCLTWMLADEKLFEQLLNNHLLSTDDIRYLLQKIDSEVYLRPLFESNSNFAQYCFENYLITLDDVKRFDEYVKNIPDKDQVSPYYVALGEVDEDQGFFTYAKFQSKILYSKISDFLLTLENFQSSLSSIKQKYTEEECRILFSLVQNSNEARNLFKSIIDNNLLDQYEFKTLKDLLTKSSEKKKLKMNF